MLEHAVRRGLEHAGGLMKPGAAEGDGPQIDIPTWGIVVLAVTFIVSSLILFAVEYSLKDLIATLAMVESPRAAITVSTPSEDLDSAPKHEKEGLLESGPTITLVHQKPITSSIRASLRHLKAMGGSMSRLRGYRLHIIYRTVFSIAINIFAGVIPMHFPLRMVIVTALGGAICAPLHAAWTNTIVSTPSETRFWQRVPSRSSWKVLALPAAINAAMPYFTLFVVQIAIHAFRLNKELDPREFSGMQWTSVIARFIVVVLIGLSCSLFLSLPAIVTLIRTEASIIPEEQDTIVPFDRTFGGKVVPQILGGTGAVKFLDAWKSFGWEARGRLIRHYVKTAFVVMGMVLVVAHVLAFEVFAIMGPQLGKFLSDAKQQGLLG